MWPDGAFADRLSVDRCDRDQAADGARREHFRQPAQLACLHGASRHTEASDLRIAPNSSRRSSAITSGRGASAARSLTLSSPSPSVSTASPATRPLPLPWSRSVLLPMRSTRPVRCSSVAGFHGRSWWMTWRHSRCRSMPSATTVVTTRASGYRQSHQRSRTNVQTMRDATPSDRGQHGLVIRAARTLPSALITDWVGNWSTASFCSASDALASRTRAPWITHGRSDRILPVRGWRIP